MKKLLIAAAVAMLSLSAVQAQTTATGPNAFNVAINLTPKCEVDVPAASTLTFNYTSFQATNADTSFNFNVRCTTTLAYSLAFDTASQLDSTTGLTYTLAFDAAYASATGTGTGTGANDAKTVYGRIASGQGGIACGAATCTNAASPASETVRTVIVTY